MRQGTEHHARRRCCCLAVRLPMTDSRQARDGLLVRGWDRDRGDFSIDRLQRHIDQGEDRRGARLACSFAFQGVDGYVDEAARVGFKCRRGRVGINGTRRIPRIERQDRVEEPVHAEVSLGQGPLVVFHQPQEFVAALVRDSSGRSILGSLGTVREVGDGRERARSRWCWTPLGVGGFSTFDRSEAGFESADRRSDFIDLGTHQMRNPVSHHNTQVKDPYEAEEYIEIVVHS